MVSRHWCPDDPWSRALVAAGPIMAALAGVGVGGAIGGITGTLIGMDIPEYEAKRYEGRVRKGGILLSVHCDSSDWAHRAKEVLERTGAEDISSAGEAHADFAKSDKPTSRRTKVTASESTYNGVERRHYDTEDYVYNGTERRR